MPIENYKAFLTLIEEDGVYKVGNNISDSDWPLNFGKISDPRTILVDNEVTSFSTENTSSRGVAIDVFPLVELNDNNTKKILQIASMRGRMFKNKRHFYKGAKRIVLQIYSYLGLNEQHYRAKLIQVERRKLDSDFLGCPISPYKYKDKYKKEWFKNSVTMQFEKHSFYVPAGYKEVLTQLYGDYMTPPPISEREHLTHPVTAYWLVN